MTSIAKYKLVFVSAMLLVASVACDTVQVTPTPLRPATSLDVLPTRLNPPPTSVALTSIPTAQAQTICAPGTPPTFLTAVVLAKDATSGNYFPQGITDEFTPEQEKIHAVVTLENAPLNSKIRIVWYLVSAPGYEPNSKIEETTAISGGSRNIDFTLRSTSGPWPPGKYCIEVYADEVHALSRTFAVIGKDAPPTGAAMVAAVVLAQDVRPETFEPLNPTTTFSAQAPVIHAAVQIQNAPEGSRFRARWYPPGQMPLDLVLVTGGTRWLDFRLTPGEGGYLRGDYKVEIYANEELAQTAEFRVE